MRHATGAEALGTHVMTLRRAFEAAAPYHADFAFVAATVHGDAQHAGGPRGALPAGFEEDAVLAHVEHPHRRLDDEQAVAIDFVTGPDRGESQPVSDEPRLNHR